MPQELSQREAQLIRAVARRQPAMLEDLRRWVAIPTGMNHTPGLDELRGIVTSRLEALGARTTLVPGEPAPDWLYGGPAADEPVPPTAVCARLRDSCASRVLLASHLDTVFAPDDPFAQLSVAPDGATATGPGCVDMKGGIVVAVHALEALEEVGIDCSWSYLLNSDEERGSHHSAAALAAQAKQHDVGLATEPALAQGELAIARKGSGQFRIDAHGRAAHVGRAFSEGVSAVYALARAIVEVERLAAGPPAHTVSVGPLVGGEAINIVPERACCWGNARYDDAEEEALIARALDALATDEEALPRVVVRRCFSRPPKPATPATLALAELARAQAEALGQALPFARTGGVCDGNNLQAAGLPTIDTLGVRGGGLHTRSEWIELASLVERAQLLALLLAQLAEAPLTVA